MDPRRIPTLTNATALVLAPLSGLVAALAHPALRTSDAEELSAVIAHPDAFYVYAAGILISSILFVPALFGIMALVRRDHPWAYAAGGLGQLAMLIAIGDAATELFVWGLATAPGTGAPLASLLTYADSAPGVATFYGVGALTMLGIFVLAAVLWRARLAPRWAAACLPACLVLNIAGFSMASKPVLVASYVVMLLGFTRFAMLVLKADPARVATQDVQSPTRRVSTARA